MINACASVRDRAIIAVLYDNGCRIGEIRTMKIGSVRFDKYGAKIHVCGKTGERTLRLTISVPMLAAWFNMHPQRDDPEAPLWLAKQGKPLEYQTYRSMISRIAKRAGIRTRVHAHLFRHSRAAFFANYLTQAQLCARFGWSHGSEQPGPYVHLSGKDADDAVLKLYGIERDQEDDLELLKPRTCLNCWALNAFNNRVCVNCGYPVGMLPPTDDLSGSRVAQTKVPTAAQPTQ